MPDLANGALAQEQPQQVGSLPFLWQGARKGHGRGHHAGKKAANTQGGAAGCDGPMMCQVGVARNYISC